MKITSITCCPKTVASADTCRPLEIDLYEWFRRNGSEREAPLVKNLWYSPENRDDAKTPQHRRSSTPPATTASTCIPTGIGAPSNFAIILPCWTSRKS